MNSYTITRQMQIQRSCRVSQFHKQKLCNVPKYIHLPSLPHIGCLIKSSGLASSGFSLCHSSLNFETERSRILVTRCISKRFSESLEHDPVHSQVVERKKTSILNVLEQSSSLLPYAVLASTISALVYPPSFTWFTTSYYAPSLGMLMFIVGINSKEKDFVEAFKRPKAILAGYVGQFVLKPILGYVFGMASVSLLGLPTHMGAGIMLLSCVSGAQLSNYATFLTDPVMAPLSIVMTSLSTMTAFFVTPLLTLLLIGKRLPVDVKGMISSITQIVVAPIAAGLLLNSFFPRIISAVRPFLMPLSVFIAACCAGGPLALNIESLRSPFGIAIFSLIFSFHLLGFILGHVLTGFVFQEAHDVKSLQRTMSYQLGMQSSLLALALANRFFEDPLVAVPPAISSVIMILMGFTLTMVWSKKKNTSFEPIISPQSLRGC